MNRTVRDANGREFPAYEEVPSLRKQPAKPFVLVEVKHVPEHWDIRINNTSIDKYSDEELFEWIAGIEAEIKHLERVHCRPHALTRAIFEKLATINHIIAWMNARGQ